MSKKHFISLAANLRAARPEGDGDSPAVKAWVAACKAVACTGAEMNPNFDNFKFLAACGV